MKIKKNYDPKEAEPRIQKFWEKKKLFDFDPKSKKPVYSIDTPPPTVSGLIHVGHVLAYSPAEYIARFWRMMGYNIFYPMGFDDNGLASERFVEKKLGVKAVYMPREQFIKLCLKETKIGGDEYRDVWQKLGISVDWSLTYSTINPLCQKISQLSFIDLYKKGRVYKQEGPTLWCPVCRTAIAQAELEDLSRKTALSTIVFDLKDSEEKIKIATTRPELLSACVGIFVNPGDSRYKNLVGKRAIVPIFNQDVPIMEDEKVDKEFGTGIVMICTFGDRTDIEWWQKHKLPLRIAIDKDGKLNENARKFKGLDLVQAKQKIIEELRAEGRLLEQKEIEQTINVHERCKTPVEFYISSQWHIRILDMKEKWLELGEKIKWHPDYMKVRYKQWVEGLNSDWCISRQRYYGIPFPVWYCKKCGQMTIAEEKNVPVDPIVSKPKKACSCGSKDFEPDRDVMDTWTTSSLTPLICTELGKNLKKKIYPFSLRPQGYDIIRTWAFYTIVKNWLHEKSIPWKAVMANGMGLDPKGKAMHKSRGNVVEPLPVKEKYSADALRYWATSVRLGEDLPYHEKDVIRGQKLVTKLWNASKFTGANIKAVKKSKLTTIDRWILSKLMKVVSSATESFKACEYSQAKSETEAFFWHEFCDNYLEMVKHRLYRNKNKKAAQHTLYKTLLTVLKLLSPVIPHITEEIYQLYFKKYEKDVSIHVSPWPKVEKLIDKKSEEAGELAKVVISALRQFKSSRKLPLNAEIKKIVLDKKLKSKIKAVENDIKGTMKVKKIEFGKAKEIEIPELKIKLDIKI